MPTLSLPRWVIVCLYVAGAAIGVTLLIQHWVHVPLVLPWLVFLACPLMHLFMHHGHKHHHHHEGQNPSQDS